MWERVQREADGQIKYTLWILVDCGKEMDEWINKKSTEEHFKMQKHGNCGTKDMDLKKV